MQFMVAIFFNYQLIKTILINKNNKTLPKYYV